MGGYTLQVWRSTSAGGKCPRVVRDRAGTVDEDEGVEKSEVLDDIERWGGGHRRYALRSLGGLQSEALQ